MTALKEIREFTTTVATINNFPPQENKQGAVIYFCESHNKSLYERQYVQSTTDIFHRYESELIGYEKYELRTGYLSRWNYMPKDFEEMSSEEIQQSIKEGYEEENEWLQRCEPQLPESFIPKDWKDCISEKENPYYQQCKEFINQELQKNQAFNDAFKKSVETYAKKHKSNPNNGWKYVLEEVTWVFSLPLVHPNKYIYLVHVGSANPAIKALFTNNFPNFNKVAKWLRPHIREANFKNDVDFLMYYNANRNVGCSYAVDNRNIVNPFMKGTIIDKSNSSLRIESVEKTLLEGIIEKLPCHIYWLNRENVYLGCNEAQAKEVGLKSRNDIVGKTNFDFHDSSTAKELNDINELVMSTGKPYEVEESGYVLGQHRDCLSKKVAVYDTLGKVVGLLGVSFDITERKQKEELERKLEMQKELYTIAKEVAHDINSPVTSIKMVEYMSRDRLPDKEKKMLELSITNIEEMARKLTEKYKVAKEAELGNVSVSRSDRTEDMYIAPYLWLSEVLNRHEYRDNKNYNIKYYPDEKNKMVFIKGDCSDFCRMMLNIINNGLEAVEGKKAEIKVGYEIKREEVEIRVKDNGKGMPKEMVEKIVKGQEIRTTKKEGHGIGTQQIMNTIKAMNGNIKIESKEEVGTEVILIFAACEKPRWFADKIEIKNGDTVVIVDDEESVHAIWKEKLKLYDKDITVKYFTKGLEAIEYISSLKDRGEVLLLTKYELKVQEVNGIEVIEKSNMKDRHILITGLHLSKIKDFNEKSSYLKIFYKNLLNDISVSLVDKLRINKNG